jgi:hypothetical protein
VPVCWLQREEHIQWFTPIFVINHFSRVSTI